MQAVGTAKMNRQVVAGKLAQLLAASAAGCDDFGTGADDHTVRKLPGLKKFANLVLKRGFMKNDAAWKWRKMVLDGKTGDAGGRRSGSITLLGEDKKPVLQWDFYGAWPAKVEGPSLNAKNNEVAVETLELAIERLEFKAL